MRWKLTYGRTFWSTSAITLRMSPAWIVLSALTASRTSVETSLMRASGAFACAWAPSAAKDSSVAASQPSVLLVMDISSSSKVKGVSVRDVQEPCSLKGGARPAKRAIDDPVHRAERTERITGAPGQAQQAAGPTRTVP